MAASPKAAAAAEASATARAAAAAAAVEAAAVLSSAGAVASPGASFGNGDADDDTAAELEDKLSALDLADPVRAHVSARGARNFAAA